VGAVRVHDRRLQVQVVLAALLAILVVGCGSTSSSSSSKTSTGPTTTAKVTATTGTTKSKGTTRSKGKPKGTTTTKGTTTPVTRVCGYFLGAHLAASSVTVKGMACRTAAGVIRAYFKGYPRVPKGWRSKTDCKANGASAPCKVQLVRGNGKFVFTLTGKVGDRVAPQPITGKNPGDRIHLP
jgi:hypothetical protein